MRVTITVAGAASAKGGDIREAEIGETPFVIGRSETCDLIVEDRALEISRVHCELRLRAGALTLTDLSSNGTSVGAPSNRLVKGQPTPLPDSATLLIGGARIELRALRDGEAKPAAGGLDLSDETDDDLFGVRDLARSGRAAPAPGGREAARPLDLDADEDDGLFGDAPGLGDDPLGVDAPPQRGEDHRDPTPDMSFEPGRAAPRKRPDPGALPDDWMEEEPPAGPEAPDADEFDKLLDEAFEDPERPEAVASPALRAAPQAGPSQGAGPASGGAAPGGRSLLDRREASGADLRAVFEAVGLDPDTVPPDRRAELLLEIARQHRAMADGLRRLLMMRRDAKIALGIRSSQVEVGMNPLKWAPDADAAVEALLGPRTGSYKRGAEAIDDAVRALEAHQLALIGGVKAALRVALDAFDPAELERKLKAGGLSAVVPQLRRAELWDKFVENYEGFVDQANEDVRAVLGRELDKLYSDGTRDGDPLD